LKLLEKLLAPPWHFRAAATLSHERRIPERLANIGHLSDVIRVVEREKSELVGDSLCTGQLHGGGPGQMFVIEGCQFGLEPRARAFSACT
jgi:hypothetical protein